MTDIVPADYNPRVMSSEDYESLSKSINEFGLVDPIIINLNNNHIIGGHQRYDVLLENYLEDNNCNNELDMLSLGDIGWCFFNENLKIKNDDYEKALNIALNKINGDWDNPKLLLLLSEIEKNSLDIELTGFDNKELNELQFDIFGKDNYFFNEIDDADAEAIDGCEEDTGSFDYDADVKSFTYNIDFINQTEADLWYDFIDKLNKKYPEVDTIAHRILLGLSELLTKNEVINEG